MNLKQKLGYMVTHLIVCVVLVLSACYEDSDEDGVKASRTLPQTEQVLLVGYMCGTNYKTFNQTIVELKRCIKVWVSTQLLTFNRTSIVIITPC